MNEEQRKAFLEKAAALAHKAHYGQKRKYTGDDYFVHCYQVAELVARHGGTPEMIAAAYLHDTLEDTDLTYADIVEELGDNVADLVMWLTDVSRPSDGKREIRKELDRNHLANAPYEAQTIKCADLIDNTSTIVQHDPGFAKIYLREKAKLLDVLHQADPKLHTLARDTLNNAIARLAAQGIRV